MIKMLLNSAAIALLLLFAAAAIAQNPHHSGDPGKPELKHLPAGFAP